MIRLRQVCLVARDRDTVVGHLENVFGIRTGYNDPHIHRLGLHNAVIPVGDQFIEVVAPVVEGTTAERYLNRRDGDVTIGRNCGMHKVRPVDFCVRFTPAGNRGEGLDAIDINVKDANEILRRARDRSVACDDESVTIGGVRFLLKQD